MKSISIKATPAIEPGLENNGLIVGVTMDEKAANIIDRLLSWIFSREAGYLIAMGHPKPICRIQEDLEDPWLMEAMEYLKEARNQGIAITGANSEFIDKYLTKEN